MNNISDVEIRFEALKIAANKAGGSCGIQETLFDANQLYDFIKTGTMPKLETAKQNQSLHGE